MQSHNPVSRSGINISADLRCKRMAPPLIDQRYNIANVPNPISQV